MVTLVTSDLMGLMIACPIKYQQGLYGITQQRNVKFLGAVGRAIIDWDF